MDSTNNYASKLLQTTTVLEGTLIKTDFQTGGKGHFGSKWFSSAGKNVLISIVLNPSWLTGSHLTTFNKAIALAVQNTISEFLSEDVFIKWPNDILVGNKKISGILIENTFKGSGISHSIVGIGININESQFPESLSSATTMLATTGKKFDVQEIITILRDNLAFWYQQLYDGEFDMVISAYHQKLFGVGQWMLFKDNNNVQFFGQVQEVDALGNLVILEQNGTLRSFAHKEVSMMLNQI